MLSDLIPLLDSADAPTRQQAIRQIANLRDPAALPHLARVHRTDTDPAVRELALKAGRFIREATAPTAEAASSSDEATPADGTAAGEVAERPPLTARERDMARRLLDSAAGFAVQNDAGRAVEHLGKALALDPDLGKEAFTVNLVTTLTGLSVNQAMPVLVHPDRRAALIEQVGGKRKLKTVQTHGKGAATATWDRAAIDFAIYWVLNVVAMLAMFVIVFASLQGVFDEYGTGAGGVYSSTASQVDDIVAASIIGLLLLSLLTATLTTIGLAINGAIIHFAATMVFGGTGTLVYLYRRYISFNTLVLIITIALAVLISVLDSPGVMLVTLGLGSIAAAVAIIYFTVQILSDVYAFGMASGCGALLVAGIIQAAMQCGLQWMLSGLISALLEIGT